MKNAQKELKEMYKYILERDCWKNSPDMVNYCLKELSQVVVLNNGQFIVLNKPSIETRFCFGYGYTSDDYKTACDMANYAATNENYFIKENLEKLENELKDIETYDIYFGKHYYGQPDGSPLVEMFKIGKYSCDTLKDDYRKASPEEIEIIKAAYLEEIEKFKKRLNTYLKRYGLKNIHSWTYNSWD